MSSWVDEGCVAIVRFIGSTVESFDTRQLLYNICVQIALVVGTPREEVPNEYKELQQYFFDTLNAFPEDRNLVIFLDALHILVPQYNAHYLHWLPKVIKNKKHLKINKISIIFSEETNIFHKRFPLINHKQQSIYYKFTFEMYQKK